jgi:uncharacterized protein YkwD
MTLSRLAVVVFLAGALPALAACSSGSGGGGPLSAGLTARMDQPGASLNRAEALGIVNHYRAVAGAPPLTADSMLDATAAGLAATYAQTGTSPVRPEGLVAMRASAGYGNFADTFSGWRNSPADAAVLADRNATRAGIAVTYDENSTYGVYWVLLLDD